MKLNDLLPCLLAGVVVLSSMGCNDSGKKASKPKSNYDASLILTPSPIEGAVDVMDAKGDTENETELSVIGRIGGSLDPWVKGRAAFSIVDQSLRACSDETPEGETCSCKTPWDYCCETDKLKQATILVKFVDSSGQVIKHDAREIFPIKELQTVVVSGKAQRDASGNLTILASRMFTE